MKSLDLRLSAYLRRIGVKGPLYADLPTLQRVHNAHVRHIPFENLSVLLGEQISLEPEHIEDKLIAQKRGGYCFEQNGLLATMLQAIGFEVHAFAGRARVAHPRAYIPARTHVWLRVTIDGLPWMVDAGLGGLTPTMPLPCSDGTVQRTPQDMRRLVWDNGRWFQQVHIKGDWQDVSELLMEPMPAPDREVASWYTSQHPNSDFRARLMAAKATDHGRATLNNRSLTLRSHNSVERSELMSAESLRSGLEQHFGLHVSGTQAQQLFASACAAQPKNSKAGA